MTPADKLADLVERGVVEDEERDTIAATLREQAGEIERLTKQGNDAWDQVALERDKVEAERDTLRAELERTKQWINDHETLFAADALRAEVAALRKALERIEHACNQQVPRSHLGGLSTSEFAHAALADKQEPG